VKFSKEKPLEAGTFLVMHKHPWSLVHFVTVIKLPGKGKYASKEPGGNLFVLAGEGRVPLFDVNGYLWYRLEVDQ